MTTIRRFAAIAAAIAALLALPAQQTIAGGNTPAQLTKAHWDCITPAPGDNIHCAPPGGLDRVVSHEAETMTFKVFHKDTEEYLGTELIVRDDVYNRRPCPTDPPSGQYTYLKPLLGLDYWACHRYNSSF